MNELIAGYASYSSVEALLADSPTAQMEAGLPDALVSWSCSVLPVTLTVSCSYTVTA